MPQVGVLNFYDAYEQVCYVHESKKLRTKYKTNLIMEVCCNEESFDESHLSVNIHIAVGR